jgi:DNA-binding MarR family transcriptional regulator
MEINSIEQKDRNNNHVPVQRDLFGNVANCKVTKLRLRLLSDQQLFVLKEFYMNLKPLCQTEIVKRFNYQIHENTIKNAVHIFFNAGLISYVPNPNKNFKYFSLTSEGAEEFENQIKIRPNPLPYKL